MKEFIEYIVKNLVDSPDLVDVRCYEGDSGVIVEVRVDNGDIAKVVGRKGMTIQALRTITRTVSARLGRKIHVELVD